MGDERNDFLNKSNVVAGIAMIVVGVIFCALRSGFVSALMSVIGALCVVYGVFDLVSKRWLAGGMKIAIGILIIIFGWTIVDVSLLVLGIIICAYAIYTLISHISMFKSANINNKVFILLNPLMQLIFGILLIVARWYMLDAVFIVLGVLSILYGIALFFKREKDT